MELVLAQQIVSEFFSEGKVIQIEEINKGLINQTFVVDRRRKIKNTFYNLLIQMFYII